MRFKIGYIAVMLFTTFGATEMWAGDWTNLLKSDDPYGQYQIQADTIPLRDRDGDFTTETNVNPFDIVPSDISQEIEYDPTSDTYIIKEKIGDEYFRMPSYMSFEEYLKYKGEQQDKAYMAKLSGIGDKDRGKSGLVDPMSKINIKDKMIDRLFGGNEITIKPQGNIDITLGTKYNFVNNGINPSRKIDRWTIPYFNQNIKINVDGKIGDKMDLGFNYDTQATFDFDRKINLVYDSEKFSEDDIIKRIEAGNVSMPLRSQLIQGSQKLFGLKTEVQFGHLRLTGLVSMQQSKQKNLQIQNGATIQEFEIRPQEYDENRHFFISHYHRNNYEAALDTLPHIASSFTVANIEVWISDDRPDQAQNSTSIMAISDIGEPDPSKFTKENANYAYTPSELMAIDNSRDVNQDFLPWNKSNQLFDKLATQKEGRQSDVIKSVLKGTNFELSEGADFEQFTGRQLSPSEYTFHPELGVLSLNVRLRPNQILAVSYEYFYTQNCDAVYRVGELATDSQISSTDSTGVANTESVIFSKLLKGQNQQVDSPLWDLMMKNVYSLRTNNLTTEDFRFDVFYEDDFDKGTLKKYIPEDGVRNIPLLSMFNLDNLNSVNDPQPDGIFDFVPGITVIPRTGSIIFPVLEPFGKTLAEAGLDSTYTFESLYDESVTDASLDLVQNKFIMKGQYKSNVSSEINLGSWNIPRGSVTVRAGGRVLIEGQDYEVDYGVGRLRIINDAYLQQGVPLDISLEDQSIFNLQQRSMMGLRADYEVNKDFTVGGTFMRLAERPITQKVNIGQDPINNKVFGLDMNYYKKTPWLTKALDKLPIYSTKAESSVNVIAEVAALIPGHNKFINGDEKEGVVNLDDFEGAVSGIPLGTQPFAWQLSSVPSTRPEADDSITSGYNRAMLNWYVADITARNGTDNNNPYSRAVNQRDIFPNRDIQAQLRSDLFTFDMVYDPNLRGPYNFDPVDGVDGVSAGIKNYDPDLGVILNNPEERWAGITRYMNNSDFQAQNYEFIDFWMMNPFMEQVGYDGQPLTPIQDEEGYIEFNLGNISEDILFDNLQSYENAIPVTQGSIPVKETVYGNIPNYQPPTGSFDLTKKDEQDIGLDCIDDATEFQFHQEYITQLQQKYSNIPLVEADPANDNYEFYGDNSVYDKDDNIVNKYGRFSLPENNSPNIQGSGIDTDIANVRGKFAPDSEDLNGNNSLDQAENYYKYRIPIKNNGGEIARSASDYITDEVVVDNANTEEKWYRFRIPIQDIVNAQIEGEIQGFRSIQFMRMLVGGFTQRKIFRLAEFELVRSQWRVDETVCADTTTDIPIATQVQFSLDIRGIENNSNKEPFNYVEPPGIQRERIYNSISNTRLDEKALALVFRELSGSCEGSAVRLNQQDLRVYKKLQMFVHAEEIIDENNIEDGDLELFVRIGKDFEKNYYEYTIPLVMSKDNEPMGANTQQVVWRDENKMDVPISALTDLKRNRNSSGASISKIYYEDAPKVGHKIGVIGNPSLGYVKGVKVGVRNAKKFVSTDPPLSGEVWINEFRAVGLDERGGVAGLARMDVQLADLGALTVSGKYNTVGWGSLDQRVNDRSKYENIDYDIAANLALGKFLPSAWNVSIPFYAQYVKSISNPLFDPFDSDITIKEKLSDATTQFQKDSIKNQSQEVKTIKTFNFTNVKKGRTIKKDKPKILPKKEKGQLALKDQEEVLDLKNKKNKKAKTNKPMPWDISNFSVSYGYTETDYRDPYLASDNTKEYNGKLDYNYSRKVNYIQPFKKVKNKNLRIIKEFNFNLLPNSFGFNATLNRRFKQRRFRLPDVPVFQFDEKNFTYQRKYDLTWDFTKSLNMKFTALNQSYVDELRQVGIAETAQQRNWVNEDGEDVTEKVDTDANYVKDYWMDNFRAGGRNKNYSQQLSLTYNVPIRYLPMMDWVTIKAQYRGGYNWVAGPLIPIDNLGNQPGATIANSQNRSVNATFAFDKLYKKFDYYKRLEKTNSNSKKDREKSSRRNSRRDAKEDLAKVEEKTDAKLSKEDRKKQQKTKKASVVEKLLVRPLFMLESFKLAYKEDLSTQLPGFMRTPNLLGMEQGFGAPGLDFVAGLQPDITKSSLNNNWLYQNVEWWNTSKFLNKQITQVERQDLQADLKLEPWKNFTVDLKWTKKTGKTHSEEFTYLDKTGEGAFYQQALYDVGQVEFSYYTLNTLLNRNSIDVFNTLRDNRSVISQRLGQAGTTHEIDGKDYTFGYGKLNNDVVVPAFIAAYTDTDPNTVELDIINASREWNYLPKPNWNLKYSGLNKLPWFENYLKTFTLRHGYSSIFSVSRFNSDPQYDKNVGTNAVKEASQNYYTRWEVPSIQINEQFSPLIGFDIQTKNNVRLKFEYKKSRMLNLFTTVGELREQKVTEWVVGAGYKIDDVRLGNSKKRKKRKKKKKQSSSTGLGNVLDLGGDDKPRAMIFDVSCSFNDNITYAHDLRNDVLEPQAIRGTKTFRINPSIEYDLNRTLSLRWYADYSRTLPHVTPPFPVVNFESAVVVRFKLN